MVPVAVPVTVPPVVPRSRALPEAASIRMPDIDGLAMQSLPADEF